MKNSKQNLFLISLESEVLFSNYKKTVEKPVKINLLKNITLSNAVRELETISIWSFNDTKENKQNWNKIKKSDVILFLKNGKFFSKGEIFSKINEPKIAEKISYNKPTMKSRNLIIFLINLQLIDINFESSVPVFANPVMPKSYNFPIKMVGKKQRNLLIKSFGTLENAINVLGNPENKEKSISEIIDSILLKNEVKFGTEPTIIKQRKGQEQFRKNILSNFRNKCSVCSNSQVDLLEAGHIVPIEDKGKSGQLKNGICFCVLCHKLFDNGYFSFDENYKIKFSKTKKMNNILKNLIQESRKIGKCLVYPSKEYLSLHRAKFDIF